MLRTNQDKLVMISVQGRVSYPVRSSAYTITYDGKPVVVSRPRC